MSSFSSSVNGLKYISVLSGFLSPKNIPIAIGWIDGNSCILNKIGQNALVVLLCSGRPSTFTLMLIEISLSRRAKQFCKHVVSPWCQYAQPPPKSLISIWRGVPITVRGSSGRVCSFTCFAKIPRIPFSADWVMFLANVHSRISASKADDDDDSDEIFLLYYYI